MSFIQISVDYMISLMIFLMLIFLLNEIQTQLIIWSLRSFISEITLYEKLSKRAFMRLILVHRWNITSKDIDEAAINEIVKSKEFIKVNKWIDEIINSFLIYPVTIDPTGILSRLEHILDVRRSRLRNIAQKIIPSAPERVQKNLESALEAAAAIRYLWKITSHIYEVGYRTKNIYYLLQLKLLVPFIRELCLSYFDALKGFVEGVPIGDSVGALVALHFFGDIVEVDEDLKIAYSSSEFEGRYVLAVKAKGPGSEVGYPGRFLEKILEKIGGDVNLIITVDAALRLESENTGKVDVGVGAAIGDPGPEKYRIESWTSKYKIPLYAVVIKENYVEALTPLSETLLSAVYNACEVVKRIIIEEVPSEGKVIILGIGNTIGVGNIALPCK
ncbi:MAG: DUF1512 family protein [Candidatus Korarchaeota archaeon]|nr:DUF1512 domain-containing protein [Thermoproteota archaeon]MCR8470923.1 DUF1512 domain-containing protein [Thermoproteota archaeon]MCR8472602.1 DUF1512 domain-containing protein [Thermoproteota archaeon]MCR8472881.1 DUF1512 domain-containing protein [Thermoproteota archaeon]MCR8488969.1 DUF1512 domain-containing protein [Thermoproteota archaeon]